SHYPAVPDVTARVQRHRAGSALLPREPHLPRPARRAGTLVLLLFPTANGDLRPRRPGRVAGPDPGDDNAGGRHHPPASGLPGSARARRAPPRRGTRGDGSGLAGLGQLALLAAL